MKAEGIARVIYSSHDIYIQSLHSHLQNVSMILKELVRNFSTMLESKELEMIGVYHDVGKGRVRLELEIKNSEVIDHYPQHTQKWKDINEVYSEINSTKHREVLEFLISNHHGFRSEEILHFCLFKVDDQAKREIPKLLYLLKQADDICACSAKALISPRTVEPRPFDEIFIEQVDSDLVGLSFNPIIKEFEVQLYYEFYKLEFEQLLRRLLLINKNYYRSEKSTSQLISEISQIAQKIQLYPMLKVRTSIWKT